jgi:hypothetical protein
LRGAFTGAGLAFTAVAGADFAFGAADFFTWEGLDFATLALEADLALRAGLRFAALFTARFLAAAFLAGDFDFPAFFPFAATFFAVFLTAFFTAFFAVFFAFFALTALRPRAAFDAALSLFAALARFGAGAFFTVVFFFDLAALAITRPSGFATMPAGSRSHEALRVGGVSY